MKNGYAPSIMQDDECCYLCGRSGDLARHEVFFGPNRSKSKRLGLWVLLCPDCHQYGEFAVHRNADVCRSLQMRGQIAAMRYYGWTVEQFRQEFGKSYFG